MDAWTFALGATAFACLVGAWLLLIKSRRTTLPEGLAPKLRLADVCVYAHAPLGPNVFRGVYRGAPIVAKRFSCTDNSELQRNLNFVHQHWAMQSNPTIANYVVEVLGYAIDSESQGSGAVVLHVFFRHAGISLSHLLRSNVTPVLRVEVLARTAQAIASIHHTRLAHGAIKGTCVFIDSEGSVRLGLSIGLDKSSLWWSAPEQVLSFPVTTVASAPIDVWSFGMIMFEAFGRCAPWECDLQRGASALEPPDALATLRVRLSRSPLELPLLPQDAWSGWPSNTAKALSALWTDCCHAPPSPWWMLWSSSTRPRPSMAHVHRSLRDALSAFQSEIATVPPRLLEAAVQRILLDMEIPATYTLLQQAIAQHARLTDVATDLRFDDEWKREGDIMASPNYGQLVFVSSKAGGAMQGTRSPAERSLRAVRSPADRGGYRSPAEGRGVSPASPLPTPKSHVATIGKSVSLPIEGPFSEQELAEVGKLVFALQVLRNRHALPDDPRVHGVSASYVEVDALLQRVDIRLVSVSPNATYTFTEARKWRDAMGGALLEREVAHIVRELCLALRASHAAGVLHRNVNMGALYLLSTTAHDLPDVVLSSWSFSCRVDEVSWLKGDTLPSMREAAAPEYAHFAQHGGRSRTSRFRSCDVFQVGITAYHLLGGDLFSREPTTGVRRFGFPFLREPSAALLEFLSLSLNDDPARRPGLDQLIASPWLTRRFAPQPDLHQYVGLQRVEAPQCDVPGGADGRGAGSPTFFSGPLVRPDHVGALAVRPRTAHPPMSHLGMRDLTLLDGSLADAFLRTIEKGSYGRVVFAMWQPHAAPPGPSCVVQCTPPRIRVALKVIVGQSPGGKGGNTSYIAFLNEAAVLAAVRKAVDDLRMGLAGAVVADADGRPIAEKAGLRLLCYTYCTGTESDGARYLPKLQAEPGVRLVERDTPPDTPLHLIAMEPLVCTLLQQQAGLSPLSRTSVDVGGVLCAAADLFAALAALHGLGYAHSDVKFDNLMFDKRGRLRLVDFGVSRRVRGGVMSIGTANGAESTRAPELHREPHAANTRAADMWSAGLVLYELCNELGASPYCADAGGRPVDDWLKRVKAGVTPESVLEVKDGTTHRTVVDVMRSCLQGDPKERPSATKAFNDLISAFPPGKASELFCSGPIPPLADV